MYLKVILVREEDNELVLTAKKFFYTMPHGRDDCSIETFNKHFCLRIIFGRFTSLIFGGVQTKARAFVMNGRLLSFRNVLAILDFTFYCFSKDLNTIIAVIEGGTTF